MRRLSAWIPFAVLATAVTLSLGAGSAFAADETAETGAEGEAQKADPRSTDVETITITSRKREENQQKTPVAVTAFTATQLGEFHVSDASGISDLTPNLMINRTTSGSTSYLTCMRGMCRTDTVITDDPYVGIYLNGVYTGKAIGSVFEIADIERIEVNRGPQGTLFGKNTIGGAVNIVTAKPSGEAGTKLTFLGGSYTTTNFKAVVDLPEVAGFSTKLAYLTKHHDAYTRNTFIRADGGVGRDLQDESKHAFLADLLWEPTDSFSADFVFDYSRVTEAPWATFATSQTGVYVGLGVINETFNEVISSYEEGEGAKNNAESQGYALTLTWETGDLGPVRDTALKSITAHRRYWNDYNVNSGATNTIRNLWTQDRFDTQNTSQELQFTGTTWDDRISILAGFYYLHEQGDYSNQQGFLLFTPGPTPLDLLTSTDIEYDSYALFTEETLAITDELKLAAGVRWTYEHRMGGHAHEPYTTPPGPTGPANPGYWTTDNGVDSLGVTTDTLFTSSTWAPRVTLSYQATEDLLLFGGWTRGFKSGGFNARSVTAETWNPYDDQTVDSFEAGFKSDLWDKKARLNITGFYALNKDMQIQFNRLHPVTSAWEVILANAGDADIYGAEAEAIVRPIEGLELRAGFGITSFKFDEVINHWTGVDEKDNRHLEYAPKYNWNLSGRYIFPSFGFATASARIDYTGYSDIGFNTAISDDKVVGQSPYGLLHFRVALDEILPDLVPGDVGVAFIGRNVTNKAYRVGGYQATVPGQGSYAVNVYGDPRFFGGEISYRWGSGL